MKNAYKMKNKRTGRPRQYEKIRSLHAVRPRGKNDSGYKLFKVDMEKEVAIYRR